MKLAQVNGNWIIILGELLKKMRRLGQNPKGFPQRKLPLPLGVNDFFILCVWAKPFHLLSHEISHKF